MFHFENSFYKFIELCFHFEISFYTFIEPILISANVSINIYILNMYLRLLSRTVLQSPPDDDAEKSINV